MRNEKCVTTGISEDTQSAYEPTASSCLGHMVAVNVNMLGRKFSPLKFRNFCALVLFIYLLIYFKSRHISHCSILRTHVANVFVRNCLNSYTQVWNQRGHPSQRISFGRRRVRDGGCSAPHASHTSVRMSTRSSAVNSVSTAVNRGRLVQRPVRHLKPACCQPAESAQRVYSFQITIAHVSSCYNVDVECPCSLPCVHLFCQASFAYSSAAVSGSKAVWNRYKCLATSSCVRHDIRTPKRNFANEYRVIDFVRV